MAHTLYQALTSERSAHAQALHERGIELGTANARLQQLDELATRIMQYCNEASSCPFCGNDGTDNFGEHEKDGYLCSELDVLLNGEGKR